MSAPAGLTTVPAPLGECGYMRVNGQDFALRVVLDGPARRLDACPGLRAALEGQEPVVMRRLQHATDVQGFIAELHGILQRSTLAASAELPAAEFYELLIRELDEVG